MSGSSGGKVRVLEPAVSCRVRSAHAVHSVAKCVLELVENGVDAGATTLVVEVDTAAWKVQVSDNGSGISREELSLVGERYASSKLHGRRKWFGFRGEALASIVQVSHTVEITSRHCLSQLTCCKGFKGGRSSGLVPPPANLGRAGTVVTARGLFYNLPVRRRHLSPSVEVEKLRHALCEALLVLPEVSLSLHDGQAGCRLLQVSGASSLLARFHQLFQTKSVVQQSDLELDSVKLSALFATQPLGRNSLQLIFVNRRSVEWESVHELVSTLLKPVMAGRNLVVAGKPRLFYIISIEFDVQFDSDMIAARAHLQQERKVGTALTSLIRVFLSNNNLPNTHCLLPAASIPSQSLQPLSTTASESHSRLSSPPPACQLHSAKHWTAVVDPATNRQLQLHPVSGCSLHARQPQQEKGRDSNYVCALQIPSNCTKPRLRAASALSSSLRAPGALSLMSHWINPTFSAGEEAVLNIRNATADSSTSHCKFSKGSLKHTRVLGQVADRFIACLFGEWATTQEACLSPGPLLVAVDQHAAHERVRLEALLRDLYDDKQVVKMTAVVPPLPLSLSATQQRVARKLSGKLEAIGVRLQWREGQPMVIELPAILMEREAGEMQPGHSAVPANLLQDMVESHLEVLASSVGGVAGLPPSLASVLHSRACHGAIRFGDPLDLSQCQQLISSLAECSLPFQCAHGRPSLAPLVDLADFARRCPSLQTQFPSLRELANALPA